MFNILMWSPQTSWATSFYSPHLYLFKTHYKYHGQYPDSVNWFTYDTFVDSLDISKELLESKKPDVIFLGIYPWNKTIILELIEMCQTHFPEIPIFIGGITISFNHLSEYKHLTNIKGFVQGEGEVPIALIVDKLIAKQPVDDVPGLWTRHNDVFIKPQMDAPRITWEKGIGPKNHNFFEIDYSWILENANDIFSDIVTNCVNESQSLLYFVWESTRGCPYECVYCDWGGGIKTKVRRKPSTMIKQELDVIFKNFGNIFLQHSRQFRLHPTDANFGIFPQDIETAQYIRDAIEKYNLVGKVELFFTFAKNNHDNVKKIQEILQPVKSDYPWSLDIQSTDPVVLESVKRVQSPLHVLSQKYDLKNKQSLYSTNFMLGLPGTTLAKDLKTMCDILDNNSQLHCFLTMVPPQSEMASPEFMQEWQIKLFTTQYEPVTLNSYSNRQPTRSEVSFMYECKSFSVHDFVDILIVNEFLQLIDGCYITKFARILANKNGFDTHSFYSPFIEKLFNDKQWIGIDINEIRSSISDWIFYKKPFGSINNTVFTDKILKHLYVWYHYKNLKQQILLMIGHMDDSIGDAIDIGFKSIITPYFVSETYEVECNLIYEAHPVCQLKKIKNKNKIVVDPGSSNNVLYDMSRRILNPERLDKVFLNK